MDQKYLTDSESLSLNIEAAWSLLSSPRNFPYEIKMDKYRPYPSMISMFTSDSQHPLRSRHAVHLGVTVLLNIWNIKELHSILGFLNKSTKAVPSVLHLYIYGNYLLWKCWVKYRKIWRIQLIVLLLKNWVTSSCCFLLSVRLLTLCMLGDFFMILLRLLIFSNLTFSKNYLGYQQSVKQFGSRSGPVKCWAWSGSKLFAKVINRRHLMSLAG